MKKNLWAASLVAMALVAGGAFAQEYPTPEEPAAEAAAPQLPEEVLNLLNDKRPAQELSDDELKNRARQARRFAKAEGLPQDVRGQLQALADADRAELEARAKAAEQAPAAEPPAQEQATEQPAEQPAQAQEQGTEQPAGQPAAEAAPLPQEVQALLADTRDLGNFSIDELKARQQAARKFSRDENLPKDVRQQLAEIGKQARQEIAKREAAGQQQEQAAPEQPEQPAEPQQEQAVPAQPDQPVEQPAAEAPAEQPAAPAADKAQVQQLDGNQGNPELEEKAKALLADETPADQLDDEKLRQRLDAMRDVMESNQLSRDTERALRKKLRADREVLRDRMAKVKAEEEAKAAAEAAKKAAEEGKTDGQASSGEKPKDPVITTETPRRNVLLDRRRSDELDDNELRIRIKVFLDFEQDPSYRDFDEEQRGYWRETVRRDRERLRRRMEEERNIRRVEFEDESNIERIDIDDENYSDDEEYDDVFAAEVDEEDIEKVLIAPPKRKVRRVASVEEIEQEPELRDSLRRIEIDTIRFGFNEAFVREEEIGSLDEIALVMEKVLRQHPRERFLVEGHTDAVGSDAYNLKLSKARAEAVKKALTTFYLIPSRNLETVGLGERYLKIPTAEAEAENRRVSISRATAVLGEAEEE
jgi:outer membrane protein OmpA-like peptidoglycan-associated protein